MSPFSGNVGVTLKAYAYILRLGREGLIRVSENAVLAANYIRKRLEDRLLIPFNRICMHEFVASASELAARKDVHALDLAKALLDKGHHAPTVYFPLIVKEAVMIEPTETEAKENLDALVEAMIFIAEKAQEDPAWLRAAPRGTPVGRLDEVRAARQPDLAERG